MFYQKYSRFEIIIYLCGAIYIWTRPEHVQFVCLLLQRYKNFPI